MVIKCHKRRKIRSSVEAKGRPCPRRNATGAGPAGEFCQKPQRNVECKCGTLWDDEDTAVIGTVTAKPVRKTVLASFISGSDSSFR